MIVLEAVVGRIGAWLLVVIVVMVEGVIVGADIGRGATKGTLGLEPVPSSASKPLDRLLALDALAVCLPFAEAVSLRLTAVVGGVIDVSKLLLVLLTLALGLGGVAHSTELLRVLVSGYQLDSGEHTVIPDIIPFHLVPPWNGQIL
nr:hypothetical protein [Tanacetum cinerariifolium]